MTRGPERSRRLTDVVSEVTGREPSGSGNNGECYIGNYNGGSWNNYDELAGHVQVALAPVCGDAWVARAIREVTRRAPNGSGNGGECYIGNYNNGSWNNYDELRSYVRARLASAMPGALLDPDALSMLERGNTADPAAALFERSTSGHRDQEGEFRRAVPGRKPTTRARPDGERGIVCAGRTKKLARGPPPGSGRPARSNSVRG